MVILIETITAWMATIGGRPLDAVFIVILIFIRRHDMAEIKLLRFQVKQLDKLSLVHAWIIKLKLMIGTVRHHRSGEYEIVDPLNDEIPPEQ